MTAEHMKKDGLGAAIFARAFVGLEAREKSHLANSNEEFSKALLQFMTFNRYTYHHGWQHNSNAPLKFQDAGTTYAELVAKAPPFLRTIIHNELTAYREMTEFANEIKENT